MSVLVQLLLVAFWLGLCLVIRHEHRAQRRTDGLGWKGPGA